MSATTIGQYEIREQVGSGGMATVYKAYHAKLDRHVAIKLMHPNFLQDPEFRARFQREAQIVARLEHPNIVPIYDFNEHDDQPYLVMKFVEGQTLKDSLRQRRLTPDEILNLTEKLAAALTYAHTRGILHRDVKPSNVILDERGEPYLTDFGLARIVQAGESTMSADVMLGTPQYISPEQARGNTDLDARTDVYALGIVLYELVTGRVPFAGDSTYAIIHDHIYTPPPMPSEIDPTVPRGVENVLLKALAKNPNERYDTPDALIADYKRAIVGQPIAQPPRRDSTSPPPQKAQEGTGLFEGIPSPFKDPDGFSKRMEQFGDEMGKWGEAFGAHIEKQFSGGKDDDDYRTAADYQNWRPDTSWRRNMRGEWGFFSDEDLEAELENLSPEERIRVRVEKRLKRRNDFYGHATAYILVNLMLWAIWLFTGGDYFPWPLIVMAGWGIGLGADFIEYYTEYGAGRLQREARIEAEIEAEMARMQGGHTGRDERTPKAKNDERNDSPFYDDQPQGGIRLTDDGEFTDSYIEELRDEDDDHRQRR